MANGKRANLTDINIQIYIPLDLAIEVAKLRVTQRTTNAVVMSELLREALVARGALPAAPKNKERATPKAPKKKAPKAQPPNVEEVTPPTLPTGSAVAVAAEDEVAVADSAEADVQNDEDVIDLDELLALGAPGEGAPTSNPFELVG